MHLVLFTHPSFFPSKSMFRFASMIAEGMRASGHRVEIWTATPFAYNFPAPRKLKKWLGYIDQFVLFPFQVRKRLKHCPSDTLFVFVDEVLGPWIPLVSHRPHVVHNHGFFALRSAHGEFKGPHLSWTGRIYQHYILRGFSKGDNFISISDECEDALMRYLPVSPRLSKVVYNGLNFPFKPLDALEAKNRLIGAGLTMPNTGFLLHVGGNTWYKNRAGVLRIYKAYSEAVDKPLPLWMIGDEPTPELIKINGEMIEQADVRFLSCINNEVVQAAYVLAEALIFPSIWEGFGWPIAEAMACGCLVLTTGEAPMTVVGGEAAIYLERMPNDSPGQTWAWQSAQILIELLRKSDSEKAMIREKGLLHVQKFSTQAALDAYEEIYIELVANADMHAREPEITKI